MSEEQSTLAMPGDWAEGTAVAGRDGQRLRRWGKVREAARMLWDYSPDTIYRLIEAGEIKAVKRPGGNKNCSWRVDLVSVWEYKTRAEKGLSGKL